MQELAPDDPLNAFHEIFHRHLAVIMRFGRFPHRNQVLGRTSTPAEEAFLDDDAFRFDLPLVRQPDGSLAFAGSVKRRTMKLLDHEYETLLPAADEAAHGRLRVRVRRAGRRLHQDPASSCASRATCGSATPCPTSPPAPAWAPIRFHEFIGDSWCVLFSHPADFTPVCTTEFGATARLDARMEEARRQGHRPQRRQRRGPRALDRRHQRDPAHARRLPDHRRQGPAHLDAVRHARPDPLPPRARASARR